MWVTSSSEIFQTQLRFSLRSYQNKEYFHDKRIFIKRNIQ